MKKSLYLIIFIMVALSGPLNIYAQDNITLRQIYTQAESDYQIGRLDQALDLLQKNINSFQGNLKQSAYRLIALCYLAQDNIVLTENYANLLLKENPYYTSVQDPIRFEDIIKQLKMGRRLTISTASNQDESLDEAPVPVTLITEEMIEACGGRNLKEVLMAYVPGITNVECNEETTISMRGIYSSGQEKILIMLDGHRLNSYGTNVARPDFSISLQKIHQIEVLRGPASSLYGGVALTAVINIITKSGSEIDGLELNGALGNYGVQKTSLLFGKHFMDLDVTVWGELYKSDGEKYFIPLDEVKGTSLVEGDIIIGGFNRRPANNYGINLNWKGLHILYNSSFIKTVAPYSLSYFFSPYSYDKFFMIDGNLPGYANTASNVGLSYSFNLGKVNLFAGITYDYEIQNRYQAVADKTPDDWEYYLQPNGTDENIPMVNGGFQCLRFREENIGGELKSSLPYRFSEKHHGQITAGAHINRYTMIDASNMEGIDYNNIIQTFEWKTLSKGSENSFDMYLQVKHCWQDFILNAGIRFDHRKRMEDETMPDEETNIHEFSPRLALIYVRPEWNVKISYSKSFVDAPYFYRNNTLDTFMGGFMKSENLHSLQLTFQRHHLLSGLDFEVNGFYNTGSNLVFPKGMFYYNSGKMKNLGIELSSTYTRDRLYVNGNATWQHLLEATDYKTNKNRIYNIPEISANLNASYRIFKNMFLNANLCFYGSQYSTYEAPDFQWEPIYTEVDIPARVIANVGYRYKLKHVEVGAHVYNLFNHGYEQGGTSIGPIRQQGRWAMVDLTLKL